MLRECWRMEIIWGLQMAQMNRLISELCPIRHQHTTVCYIF